jgi:hypothetical protein
MGDTKPTAAAKAERKKPVRQAPVQKDYPNKLAWLKAMTEFEEAATAATNKAKVERIDKRIAAKKEQITTLQSELTKLETERAGLVPSTDGGTESAPEGDQPSA